MGCNNFFVINRIMKEIVALSKLNPNENILDKLVTSAHTATTSNHLFKNKISLGSCYSSISIESNDRRDKFFQERKLFMKYLLTKQQPKKNAKVFEQMKNLFTNATLDDDDQVFGKLTPFIQLTNLKYSKNQSEVVNYFCGIWLLLMGYKTEKNKSMIMDRIRLELTNEQLYSAVIFYQQLGAGLISQDQRWDLIVQTCLNGWETFCKRAIEFSRKEKSIILNNFFNKNK